MSATYRNSYPQKIHRKSLDRVNSTTDTTTMAVHHKKCHEENIELYYYHFKFVVMVPGSALTHNGHSASEFKLRSEGTRLTCSSPSFLPGSSSPTSLLLLMSCQGPGLPRAEEVRGGQTPNIGWRWGCWWATNALWHGDLETAVLLDQTVIARYPP